MIEGEPLNVTFFREEVSTTLDPVPLRGRPIATEVMGRSIVPKAFEKRKRICLAGVETRRV